LVRALLDGESVHGLRDDEWNDLLVLGERHGLLARLGAQLVDLGRFERLPFKARTRMHAACVAAESTQTAVRFEINRTLRALEGIDSPVVLLKGAAYVMAGLPPSRGRFVGDLDLMVPEDKLELVERTLVEKGWIAARMQEYDQHYYRQWMHEVPALKHPQRETPIDLHHTIAPRTSRVHPDAQELLCASVPLADPRLRVLAPADMVLHSAVHLFNDEVGKPLRDLFDLHDLLCYFGADPQFWDALIARARLHGCGRPLFYLLRYTHRLLGTPVPPQVEQTSAADGPSAFVCACMDSLFSAAFLPESASRSRIATDFSQWLLYVRSHWLRMPPLLLARHLMIKAGRRFRERFEASTAGPTA
jgi:hypothetical protein